MPGLFAGAVDAGKAQRGVFDAVQIAIELAHQLGGELGDVVGRCRVLGMILVQRPVAGQADALRRHAIDGPAAGADDALDALKARRLEKIHRAMGVDVEGAKGLLAHFRIDVGRQMHDPVDALLAQHCAQGREVRDVAGEQREFADQIRQQREIGTGVVHQRLTAALQQLAHHAYADHAEPTGHQYPHDSSPGNSARRPRFNV